MKKYAIVSKQCEVSNKIELDIRKKLKLECDDVNPDILIVIGGDGTILRAMHKYENLVDKITIFGIHTGHLGFLANYKEEDIDNISEVLNNDLEFKIEEQTLLEFSIKTNNDEYSGVALNEVSITSTPNLIVLDVLINKEKLETFRGDGLCISTPSGSTGYNKSLGGAVIDHNIDCFQITEIAGLNSNSYKTLMNPLILVGKRKVDIIPENKGEFLFTYDNNSIRLNDVKSLCVKSSNKKIKFAYINSANFVKRVNKAFL